MSSTHTYRAHDSRKLCSIKIYIIKTYSIKIYIKEIALKEEHFYRYDYKDKRLYEKEIIENG